MTRVINKNKRLDRTLEDKLKNLKQFSQLKFDFGKNVIFGII